MQDAAGLHTLDYDAQGHLVREALGGSGVLTGFELRTNFDALGRLSGYELCEPSGGGCHGQEFGYAPERSRVAWVRETGEGCRCEMSYEPGTDLVNGLTWKNGLGQSVGSMSYLWDKRDRLETASVR